MENKNKIAILCNYVLLPERVGGMDHFFWQFDAKCKENKIQVDWFFPNRSQHGEYGNLTIFDSNHQSVELFFVNFCVQNRSNYTHVITHFVELCTPFFKKIKQETGAKIFAIDHNPRPINGYPLKKKLEKKVKGLLYSRYINVFVGVSDYTRMELIKDFGFLIKKKITVINNGVLIKDIQERGVVAGAKLSFLTTSHLRESKGIQDLVKAVFLLSNEIKEELVIDIYGDGPYRNILEDLVKSLDLDKCFRFMGNSDNLKSIYHKYDYLIHPSHEETFCYTVIEALAANIKVLTTKEGGNVMGIISHLENGLLYDAKDIYQLACLIEQIWNRSIYINKKTRTIIEQRFSLDKMVKQHFALLLEN